MAFVDSPRRLLIKGGGDRRTYAREGYHSLDLDRALAHLTGADGGGRP